MLPLTIDSDPNVPLFARISGAIAADIHRGRLRAGDALPGSRTLATTLGVNRSTVIAAYDDLAAQGWVTTRPAGATVVAAVQPEARRVRSLPKLGDEPGFELARARSSKVEEPLPAGALHLFGGVPDLRLVPSTLIARAYRRAARSSLAELGYTDDLRGHPALREALARTVAEKRALAATADHVLITRGSQMALDLLARTLVRPGDVVAVESLGYPPAWGAFERAGAHVVPLPIDEHGLVVERLAELASKEPVRAVYVTPHHQYPTTRVLSAPRRVALLELARARRIAILEDDYDHQFHYEGRPVLPLASADAHGVVTYIGTLSKILAPGLRLGFVVAPRRVVDTLAEARFLVDRQGDRLLELAIAELLDDGEVERHARRMRRLYHARRDALVSALRRRLGGVVEFDVPPGGMALWARVERRVDVDAWARRSRERGVVYQIGRTFSFDRRSVQAIRLGFAARTEKELATAVDRMSLALGRG